MTKRLFDLSLALAALLVLMPVLFGIAIVVCMDSPGGAIFRQERIGRDGRRFQIYKFRTMGAGAEVQGQQLTMPGDSRITRSGAFLRRWKLDELPQLLNVVIGDMSIVGPRPEVPRYVAMWPEASRREILNVRPGITDPASLEFFDETAILSRSADPERTYVEVVLPRKVECYLQYVRTRSMLGDVSVVLRTLRRSMCT
jgi:lipopolysaccharide/colanic/teichoic acid biosynthesis glycosyltransferase